ncbi:alkene reductase [Paracoccus wurundjeri]|uniref:alkene reductase n=1 Tax=Paracoccus onubensis TaxID=1675788 RepID=UPI0027318553|nr:alkene reductase [Paracoccus onubensis]
MSTPWNDVSNSSVFCGTCIRLILAISQPNTGRIVHFFGTMSVMHINVCAGGKRKAMADLFTPFELHGAALSNRAVMAPMTRTRATEDGVPTILMRDYYAQRADAGLIITECTQISDQAHGIIRAPGIHRADQVDGWRPITQIVHDKGSRIFNQIWHPGRVSHPEIMGGNAPVAPSAIPAEGDFFLPSGRVPFTVPRALGLEEISGVVADFAQATRNAREAGFDGVEIHGANGYLLQQFLEDGSNTRSDAYGGSIENRARLTLEVVDAAIAQWDTDHVAIRLSPAGVHYGMRDSGRPALYDYLIRELAARSIAYIHVTGANKASYDAGPVSIENVAGFTRARFPGAIIINGGYNRKKAERVLAGGDADLVAFGVPFLANPDLLTRMKVGAELNRPDPATFYGEGIRGYTDYPFLTSAQA